MGKAQQKYKAENTWKITVEVNRRTEPDLIRFLQKARYGYNAIGITPAIKAACRKQIPQCVEEKEICGETHCVCPNCGEPFQIEYRREYCTYCGQRVSAFTKKEQEQLDKAAREFAKTYLTPEVSPGDVEPEVSPGDVEPEVSPGDVEPGDVSPGDVEPGDVEPGDVSPGDVEPDYIGKDAATESALKAGHYIPWYRIDYTTKRNGIQSKTRYVRNAYISTKKAAISLFRKWHEENYECKEGHAFTPIASYEAPPAEYRWPE